MLTALLGRFKVLALHEALVFDGKIEKINEIKSLNVLTVYHLVLVVYNIFQPHTHTEKQMIFQNKWTTLLNIDMYIPKYMYCEMAPKHIFV